MAHINSVCTISVEDGAGECLFGETFLKPTIRNGYGQTLAELRFFGGKHIKRKIQNRFVSPLPSNEPIKVTSL